jgi:oxygen-independent coproporphyrinogen-3 oxidase
MPAYEISNHARPGAESRHNLTYWRYQDYAGIGPGAHGRRTGLATQRRRKPENWIEAVARNGHGIEQEEPLTPRERAVEAMLMGLRLAEGIDLDRIATLGERPIDDLADGPAIERLAAQGLLKQDGTRLCATDAGMPVLNAILGDIVRVPDSSTA